MASEKKTNKGPKKPEQPAPEKKPQPKREGKVYTLKSSAQRAAKEDGLIDGQYDVVENKKKGEPSGWKYVYSAQYKSMMEQMTPAGEKDTAPTPAPEPTPVSPSAAHLQPLGEPVTVSKQEFVAPEGSPTKAIEEAKPVAVQRQLTPDEQFKKDLEEVAKTKQAEAAKGDVPRASGFVVVDATKSVPVAKGQPPIAEGKAAPAPYTCPECKAPQADKPTLVKHRETAHNIKPKAKDTWLHRSLVDSDLGPTKYVWAVADEMLGANPKVTRKEVIAECERRGVAHWTARTQYQQWLTARRESERNAAEANHKNGKK